MNPVPGTPGPGWGGGGWRGLPPGTELWAPAGDGQLRAIRREDRRQPFLKVLLFKILFGVAKGSHDPAHRPLLRLPALRPELWHIFYSHFQIAGHSQIRFCFFFVVCLFSRGNYLAALGDGRGVTVFIQKAAWRPREAKTLAQGDKHGALGNRSQIPQPFYPLYLISRFYNEMLFKTLVLPFKHF